jgi:Sulfotransferase family
MPRQARKATRKPNLFLIGAMKSGTTYLNKLLGAHPSIFMCTPEEPTYFVDPAQLAKLWPHVWDLGFWRNEKQYLRLFESSEEAEILGEASTNYSKLPLVSGVPERISRFNKKARFIYLLRDPVKRTLSHYWHMVRYHAEHRQIMTAIKEDSQFTDVSYYAMQLESYFRYFSPDQVKVLTYEQLISAPLETMHALYEWLGVDPANIDVSILEQPENVTPEIVRMATGMKLMYVLKNTRPVRAVVPRLPLSIREAGLRLSTNPVNRRSVDTSEVIKYLQPIQRKQTDELTQLLGRGFPEWSTLNQKSCRIKVLEGNK